MPGCGCVTVVAAVFLGVIGTCSNAEQKREEARQREIAYRETQERARERQRMQDSIRVTIERRERERRRVIAERNAHAMEWVRAVKPELVDRVAVLRQSSRDFDRLIARVQVLKAENPDRLQLLAGYETRYVGVRDSLNAVAGHIEAQLVDAYVHYRVLNEQGGQSFSELTDRLLREAEDVLAVAGEIRRSTEAQTMEAGT
jgi:hypothetical protein